MSDFSGSRELISAQHQLLLQNNPHGLAHGWDFYGGLVPDVAVLGELYDESLRARSGELFKPLSRSTGDVSNSVVAPDQLQAYPMTEKFASEVAKHIGGRILSAQFNFYGPDGALLPHGDGPNKDPESTVTLSLTGEAYFEIIPDIYAGYTDNEHLILMPGDCVVLPPIPARSRRQYTSRRHAVTTTSGMRRVSLAVGYVH